MPQTSTSGPGTAGVPLPLLAQPGSYVACALDLGADARRRGYWLDLFRRHFRSLIEEAVREGVDRGMEPAAVRGRIQAAGAEFYAYLDDLAQTPGRHGRLDIQAICDRRERVLRSHGFEDAYRLAKHKENVAAMKLLPRVLADLDALTSQQQAAWLIEGIFAGNIFDLGVTATIELYQSGGIDFYQTRGRLKPRPWLIDDLDPWLGRWFDGPTHRCALLFVDNAGFDIVLGMVPFARALLQRGTGVVMAANQTASLNDITVPELTGLLKSAAAIDPTIRDALADGRLELVPSGSWTPLIDLSLCSPELAAAVTRRGVDLCVLEGMGRALESNFLARMTCDTLKIAMIKDPGVAEVYGGGVFDLVFKFEPAG